jgi:hypothetical protein
MIEYQGKKIKPNSQGQYKCPFNCHRKDYPAPKWKEKGFLKHLETCANSPSNLAIAAEKQEKILADFKSICAIVLDDITEKVGDTIFFVDEIVVKPTHVNGRKVRHEAELLFTAKSAVITSLDFHERNLCERPSKSWAFSRLYINRQIPYSMLRTSEDAAIFDAKTMQIEYDKSVKFAQDCR